MKAFPAIYVEKYMLNIVNMQAEVSFVDKVT